ncbi:MAG: hypothetical protein AAF919_14690 [Pseudomonadota bacterium]
MATGGRHTTGRLAAWVLALGGTLTIIAGAVLIAESVGAFTVPGLNVSIADGGLAILIGAAAVALSLQAHAVFDTADMIDRLADQRDRAPKSTRHGAARTRAADPVLTRRSRYVPDGTGSAPHAAE